MRFAIRDLARKLRFPCTWSIGQAHTLYAFGSQSTDAVFLKNRYLDSSNRFIESLKCEILGFGGFGLGLAIAQRVVLLHGGNITARNQSDSGLVMEIQIPVQGVH